MSESESVASVQTARLEVRAQVAETMRHAAASDDRLAADPVRQAARLELAGPGSQPWRVSFGSSVQLEVRQQAALDRDEAVRLGWPAIERQIAQALGEGDWRPSLSWLDVVELLDKPPRGLTSRPSPVGPS